MFRDQIYARNENKITECFVHLNRIENRKSKKYEEAQKSALEIFIFDLLPPLHNQFSY